MVADEINLPLPIAIDDDWLQRHITIDQQRDQYQQRYQYIRRHARAVGFATLPNAVIKLYQMEREETALPADLVASFPSFVTEQLQSGHITAHQGCGFAILSQGFVSINLWGRGNVLFTTTYTIEGSAPQLSEKPLAQTGVACTWEIRLMYYEYQAWQRYLESPQQAADQRHYLSHFLQGPLY